MPGQRKIIHSSPLYFVLKLNKSQRGFNSRFPLSSIRHMLFLFIAFLRIFTRFPVYEITLKLNERMERHIISSLFVGNNRYEVKLLKFGSRESLQDGKLSLYFSKCRDR
jgi:hypothetical protein